jgi:hypothetical protein
MSYSVLWALGKMKNNSIELQQQTFDENCRFWISPWSGWEQEFSSYEEALNQAKEYIDTDFERLRSLHGYRVASHLVDVRNG